MGAVKVLQELFPQPGRLQFIFADLGDQKSVSSLTLLKLLCLCLL
jgi:UDP-arabinose 4-epimerase